MASNYKILIIDDDRAFHQKTRIAFRRNFEFEGALSIENGLRKVKEWKPDLILLDLDLDGKEDFEGGVKNVSKIRQINEFVPIIIVSASVKSNSKGMSEGAKYALSKEEYDKKEWVNIFRGVIEQALITRELAKKNKLLKKTIKRAKKTGEEIHQFITVNEELIFVKQKLQKLAIFDRVHLFVSGETGTGKEVVARYYHQESKRKDEPFVEVHFAEIQETMMESVLFGHKKGAFTDATEDKTGLFEAADGGILFLDEIGKIDKRTQRLLLRFLESHKVRKLGQNDYKRLDILIISATNKDLKKEVEEDRFLLDLYHRLKKGMEIQLPPLRERKEDIIPLINYFIDGDVEETFTKEVLQLMKNYHWSGNIRQLKSTVEKMTLEALIADKEKVDMDCLTEELKASAKMQTVSMTKVKDAKTEEIVRNLQRIADGFNKKKKKGTIAQEININWGSDNLRSLITLPNKNNKFTY